MTAPGRFEISQKLLVWREGRVLVLRDAASGQGDLPGGRLGVDELLAPWRDALLREVREELGAHVEVQLEPEPRFAFPHRLPSSGLPALGLMWVGLWLRGEPALSDEHDDLAWVLPEAGLPWLGGTLAEAALRALLEGPQIP